MLKFTSSVPKGLSNIVQGGGSFSVFPAFRVDPPSVSGSYFPNSMECRRKWSVRNGHVDLLDDSSLALGLGCSSSSCVNVFSGKETEEESSINLDLGFNLQLRNDQALHPNNIYCGTTKPQSAERPKVDLELSLLAGPSESDVTAITQGSTLFQNSAETPTTANPLQLVDEGSTSYRWKLRPLLPPLQSSATTNLFGHVANRVNDPSLAIPNLSASFDSGSVHRRNSNVKTCQFNGCTRGARGASGFCIAHGGGRRCQRAGCHKGAEGKTVFCKAHGGGRRCEHLGCTKCAEGRTDFCIAHGGGRRCSHDGCTRAARGKSGLCIRHGGGKRCKIENCTKSAEGISGLCIFHGGGRRCQYPACTKGAQGSTMFCKAHGGGKRCSYVGCTKGAEGSTSFCKGHGGGKRCTYEGGCSKSVHGGTLFCVNHGGGKRCAVSECSKSARGRTSFCVSHGGGERCKHEGCGKSAQGSTDFCKAHGGGKRCSWGQSEFGVQAFPPCDKFARGKSGLCASHSAQVQDKQISDSSLGPESCTSEKMKGIHQDGLMATGSGRMSTGFMDYGHRSSSMQILSQDIYSVEKVCLGHFSLPEGRVHGGSLMAMLRGGTRFGPSDGNQVIGGSSEAGRSGPMPPHSWV